MGKDRGVALTDAEVHALLDEQRTVTLATIGPDGLPHLAAMWFALDGPDLLLWTYGVSQKARNVQRDPRAALLAEAGTGYGELRGVCLDCAVEVVREVEDVLAIGLRLFERNSRFDANAGLPVEAELRRQATKRVGLRLRPVRVRGWDHRKLSSGAG